MAKLIQENNGHKIKAGRSAGKIVNEYKVYEEDNGNKFVEMMTSNEDKKVPFYFDFEDLDKIEKLKSKSGNRPSWYLAKTGETNNGRDLNYIACKIKVDSDEPKVIYLHAFLMEHMGNGKGNDSVDHIDRDPLNNRQSNLRIASQSTQNKNRDKRSRPKNARPYPEGITEEEVPIYIIPYINSSNGKGSLSNYWTIEHHPALELGLFRNNEGEKITFWKSTKDKDISMRDKLKKAIEIKELMDLSVKENRTYHEPPKEHIRKKKYDKPDEVKRLEKERPTGVNWKHRKGLWTVEIKNHKAIKLNLAKRFTSKGGRSISTMEHLQQGINKKKEMDMLIEQYNQTT